MNANPYVLMIGPFLTDRIVSERGLPFRNPAASNRILRLAQALVAVGVDTAILAPASSMRLRRMRWIHPACIRRTTGIRTLFASACGVPYLAAVAEPLCMAWALRRLARHRRPDAVVIYNYYPSTLVTGLLAKWLWRTRLVLDVEDVCALRWHDWIGKGDARPVQQAIGTLLLRLGLAACDRLLVPTRRFLAGLRCTAPTTVLGGCLPIPERRNLDPSATNLRVLISGTLDMEQGIGLVLEAFVTLASREPGPRPFSIHLCGHAPDPVWLAAQVAAATRSGCAITMHGMLDDADYRAVLRSSDVAIAMQLPHGRHADLKTPSKVHEYLGHGKVVIASAVGDLLDIPGDVLIIGATEPGALSEQLADLARRWDIHVLRGARATDYADRHFSLSAVGALMRGSVLGEAA